MAIGPVAMCFYIFTHMRGQQVHLRTQEFLSSLTKKRCHWESNPVRVHTTMQTFYIPFELLQLTPGLWWN